MITSHWWGSSPLPGVPVLSNQCIGEGTLLLQRHPKGTGGSIVRSNLTKTCVISPWDLILERALFLIWGAANLVACAGGRLCDVVCLYQPGFALLFSVKVGKEEEEEECEGEVCGERQVMGLVVSLLEASDRAPDCPNLKLTWVFHSLLLCQATDAIGATHRLGYGGQLFRQVLCPADSWCLGGGH